MTCSPGRLLFSQFGLTNVTDVRYIHYPLHGDPEMSAAERSVQPLDRCQNRARKNRPILVVDDDELMRSLVAEWLVVEGYASCEAENGERALEILSHHGVALVITDMHMPKLAGMDTIAIMRKCHPGTPVIAISGHFGSDRLYDPEVAVALGAGAVLPKPFGRQDLLAAVRDLIGPPAVPAQ
jgi:DNA-binding NtrC family response regulator